MTSIGGYYHADGTPLVTDSLYNVLVTDYMYLASAGNSVDLTVMDPDIYDTSINWREPVIDWIESLGTAIGDPLDNYLDYTSRD